MTDTRSLTDIHVWIPDQLSEINLIEPAAATATVAEPVIDLRDESTLPIDAQVIEDIISLNPMALHWLTTAVHDAVEAGFSIREVIAQGRGLSADFVVKTRAVHRGMQLRQELRWKGPDTTVARTINKLADTHRRLLSSNGEVAKTLRFRARLQAMDLETTLLEYAATELIDPKILESQLTIDLLCHSSQVMPADIVLRLGLARAHLEEKSTIGLDIDVDLKALVENAWFTNMSDVELLATLWAKASVDKGRAVAAAFRRYY